MNTARRIAKNTVALLTSDIISKVLGFFYVMYTACYLGAEGFGMLSFALAFTGIFGVFTDLGLQQLTIREVARNTSLATKYLGNIAVIKFILTTVTFGLIVLIVNILGYPEKKVKVIYLIALAVILNTFTRMFYSIFQAFERMEFVSIGKVLNSVLMLFGAIYAINNNFDVVGFAFIYLVASIIVLTYSAVISVWKFVKIKVEADIRFWKVIIKEGIPFGLSSVFVTIYFYIDTVMLSLMKGDKVVGWYNAAYRLVYILIFIPAAFFSSVYPVMSKLYTTSKNSVKLAYVTSLKYIAIIAYPIALGVTIFADKLILLVFKKEFLPSIPALRILVWAVFFSYLAYATLYTLNSINRQTIYTKITFLGMILNIILNLFLIPLYSYIGASIATVCTEFVGFILMFYYIYKYFSKIQYDFLVRYTVAVLISACCISLHTQVGEKMIFIITFGLYLVALWLLKVITPDDVSFIRSIFMGHR